MVNLFGLEDTNIKFFILPSLKSFHAILGNDSLKELSAIIFTKDSYMIIKDKVKIRVKQHAYTAVNKIDIKLDHLNNLQRNKINNIVKKVPNLFTEPDEKLTFTTVVKGEIRTTSETPVYSKFYPYPMALKDEVEKQVRQLLNDGIIRPSRSPYNSPVWIVPKKSDSSNEKKYRMVIDYRKLNTVTISDKYPIPEISEVLSQLGQSKCFSVIDLKSGFHQIPLRDADIEKTAFSVNNGKYEFTRLPFGLKNAPSIFQRALDDILREHIGKICYVYIDDIVIFSKDEETHFKNLEKVFQTLERANMKVQLDKCAFLKSEVEFLGFIISSSGIRTNPAKVKAIMNFPHPKTLKDLRSFLGLSGYYRRFIKGYANLAKPLTTLLRGEGGRISKNLSSKKAIHLNDEAIAAFNKVKHSLVSSDLLLAYPDFNREFQLTTDASDYAIGAVLEQNDRPIIFISRTLNKTEESYATNEKEMLAIIWALHSLRNFLYGSRKVKIYTDHQPLTYALSNKNNNSKMKRWKAILEEYNHEIIYKPGKTNVVADALSRPPRDTAINSMTATQHSDESSSHNLIPSVETPINVFRNQLILKTGNASHHEFKTPFPKFNRHIITEPSYTKENLIGIFKRFLNPAVLNGIMTSEEVMGLIQEIYPPYFNNYKIRFTQVEVTDVIEQSEQENIILETHKRAHRNSNENRIQILEKYYFPKMSAKIKKIVSQCTTCKENKYDRHPNNPIIKATPIPQYPGHILHIDIYSTERNLVLTALDKFSKFAQARPLKSRAIEDIRHPLRELLFFYGVPKFVVIDNEKSLNSASITFMMHDQLNIEVFQTPSYKSEVNGQVERFHSTLSEIMRCLKTDGIHRSFEELLERTVYEYNSSVHSTINRKPIDIFYGRNVSTDPDQFERCRHETIERLRAKQEKDITYHNKKRQPEKDYEVGQTIYVKHNKRHGSKLTIRYKKEIVQENKPSVVITKSGRTIHKSNIRN